MKTMTFMTNNKNSHKSESHSNQRKVWAANAASGEEKHKRPNVEANKRTGDGGFICPPASPPPPKKKAADIAPTLTILLPLQEVATLNIKAGRWRGTLKDWFTKIRRFLDQFFLSTLIKKGTWLLAQ